MKKSIMIPANNIVEDDQNVKHPFMRGIMTFDDYNYDSFNDYVLVEAPQQNVKSSVQPEQPKVTVLNEQNLEIVS